MRGRGALARGSADDAPAESADVEGWPALSVRCAGGRSAAALSSFVDTSRRTAQNRGLIFLACRWIEADDAQGFPSTSAQKELREKTSCDSKCGIPDGQSYMVRFEHFSRRREGVRAAHELQRKDTKRRTNQVEVTTFELERMKTAVLGTRPLSAKPRSPSSQK